MRRMKKSTEKFDAHVTKRGTSATTSKIVSAPPLCARRWVDKALKAALRLAAAPKELVNGSVRNDFGRHTARRSNRRG